MNDQTVNGWRHQQERSNQFVLRLMVWISLRLGRTVGRWVLAFISLYFLVFAPQARRASLHYLNQVLGRRPSLLEQFLHFHAFASTIHDRIYLLNDRFNLFDIEVTGAEALMEEVRNAPGALLMGAHLGSFEVLRAVGKGHAGLKVAMLMYEDNARKINATLDAINPQASKDIVPLGKMNSMLEVRDRLDAGSLVGMLADRFLEADASIECEFLGQSARFPLGPWRAAEMMRRPVFFMVGLYMGANRYQIHFERLADFSQVQRGERDEVLRKAVHDYADRLSWHCRQAPYNWFNFYDFWGSK